MPSSASPITQATDLRSSNAAQTSTINRAESRKSYRSRSIQTLTNVNGDVDTFLEELEAKRRLLDEQIHRYVKQKDREYKLYERDMRIKFRNAAAVAESSQRAATHANSQTEASASVMTDGAVGEGQDGTFERPTPSVTPADAPKDGQMTPTEYNTEEPLESRDRESALLGSFTPAYLALLDRNAEQRSPSAPPALEAIPQSTQPDKNHLQRANSEPIANGTSPEIRCRIRLEKRTSSSGSDPGRTLVSVLRNTGRRSRLSKGKRVSLVVGDEVVAPSDNVPGGQIDSTENDPPRDDQSSFGQGGAEAQAGKDPPNEQNVASSPSESSGKAQLPEAAPLLVQNRGGLSAAIAAQKLSAAAPTTIIDTAVADRHVDPAPFAMDEEDSHQTVHDDVELEEETSNISPPLSPTSIQFIPRARPGSITMPDSSLPVFRTLSSSSSQPTTPGFSKPTVQRDPQLAYEESLVSPEIEQNQDYGSYMRSTSFLGQSGSLGESFMQRNAEEMERRKSTARQVQA